MNTQDELDALKKLRDLDESNAQAKLALSQYHRFMQADEDRKKARSLRKRLAKLAEKN